MSKINRFNGDLRAFAEDALTNERTTFGSTTQSDELSDQITPEFLRGWGFVASNEFPTLQDFSAAMYTATKLLAYLHQMGVAEWNAGQEYPTEGALVVHDGRNWKRGDTWTLGDEPGVSSSWSQIGGATAASAWVRFNGVTGTIESSYNVSSITDLGVGSKSANFITPFQNADYASFCGTNSVIISNVNNVSPSSATARTSNSDGISIDSNQISIVVFSN